MKITKEGKPWWAGVPHVCLICATAVELEAKDRVVKVRGCSARSCVEFRGPVCNTANRVVNRKYADPDDQLPTG